MPDQADIDILRGLAERKARIAEDPVNAERKGLWYRHSSREGTRPLILAEVSGVMSEVLPDAALRCRSPWARGVERSLRVELYQFGVLRDDHVVEPWINVGWRIHSSPWVEGGEERVHRADNDGRLGARSWDPPILDIDRDFSKLSPRDHRVDRTGTLEEVERLEELFAGIVPVRIRGNQWWTMGLTWTAIDLIGLENLMLFMYDQPEGLHRLMRFIYEDTLAFADWLEVEGLLSLNNENDYIGSGSMGYTEDLPASGRGEGDPVRKRDQWVLVESQETVGVGPELFEEFIFPYQLDMARAFGRCYYGCCEPVHSRWHVLRRLPNLVSVSVSPWADEEVMARELAGEYVYSRKPAPSLVSTGVFDENAIRADLRRTLELTRGAPVEIIMKDVHTLNGEPSRLARWVEIARQESERVV